MRLASNCPAAPPTSIGRMAPVPRLEARALELLALAGEPDLDRVLQRIVATARTLVGARYGALGVPDGRGGFARFVTGGIPEARARQIGHLPRVHGVLGALLEDARPIVLADIRRHPRFAYYPAQHPVMTDFLGVPVRHRGEVLGNLFLAGKRSGRFLAADRRTVETLAAYAGVAIANARLYASAQELAVIQERQRLARELHDAASQTLFSLVYEARAAALGAATGEPVGEALRRIEHRAGEALQEMRGLVHALRPKSLERDGLPTTLRDLADALSRAHLAEITTDIDDAAQLPLDHEHQLLRIAQEALNNALRHGAGAPVTVALQRHRGAVELRVRDGGPGYDPAALPRTMRTMGLATMRERAEAIGARLEIGAVAGDGVTVTVRVPVPRRR